MNCYNSKAADTYADIEGKSQEREKAVEDRVEELLFDVAFIEKCKSDYDGDSPPDCWVTYIADKAEATAIKELGSI